MKKKTTTDKPKPSTSARNLCAAASGCKPKPPCERELDDRQRYSLCRLIIDDATDRDYERGTDRKQRIAAPEGSVMIF